MVHEEYYEDIQDFEPENDFLFYLPEKVFARIMESRKFQDKDGVWRVEFVLRPDEALIQKYNLDESVDLQKGYVTKDYERKFVLFAEPGPTRITIALCDYHGVLGDDFDAHFKQILHENRELQKQVKRLMISKIADHREIQTMSSNPMGFVKKYSGFEKERMRWLRELKTGDDDKDEE